MNKKGENNIMKKIIIWGWMICVLFLSSGCTDGAKTNTITWMISENITNNDNDIVTYCDTIEKRVNQVLSQQKAPYRVNVVSQIYPEDQIKENGEWQIEDVNNIDASIYKEKNKRRLSKQIEKGFQADLYSLSGSSIDEEYSSFQEALELNLLRPLDDFYEENKEILSKVLTKYDRQLTTFDGHLYGLASQNGPYKGMVQYQKEAVQQLGLSLKDLPNDYDGFVTIMKQYKENTGNIPFPMNYIGMELFMKDAYFEYPCFGLAWTKEKGYVKISELDEFKEAIIKVQDLYKQGLIRYYPNYNEFMMIQDKLVEDLYWTGNYERYEQEDSYYVPNSMLESLELRYGKNITGISANTTKLEYAQDFLLKLMSDQELIYAIAYGIENEDYVMENNEIKPTYVDEWATVHDEIDSKYVNRKMLYDPKYNNEQIYQHTLQRQELLFENYPKDLIRVHNTDLLPAINACSNVMSGYDESKIICKMFTTEIEDIDAYIKEIDTALEQAGIQSIVDSYRKQDEQLQAKGKS